MILSVITVVRNDIAHIECTIQSVLSQTYPHIEYIIIDGASTDGTLEIIKKFQSHLAYWISEPDKGLYDAMNKGLKKATGDYVCFLNSGDQFLSERTIAEMFHNADPTIDLFYGDAAIFNESGEKLGNRRHRPPDTLTWKSFNDGMMVLHQAFIPALKLTSPYNLNYRYTSDYDWCIHILKNATHIHNTRQTLIRFLDGGISKTNMLKSLQERFIIMKINYGLLPTLWVHIRNAIKMALFKLKHGWI